MARRPDLAEMLITAVVPFPDGMAFEWEASPEKTRETVAADVCAWLTAYLPTRGDLADDFAKGTRALRVLIGIDTSRNCCAVNAAWRKAPNDRVHAPPLDLKDANAVRAAVEAACRPSS